MKMTPPAMPPAIGPMEEPLLEAGGGEGAETSGLRLLGDTATGTVTAGRPVISTTTFTPAKVAPTPTPHHPAHVAPVHMNLVIC